MSTIDSQTRPPWILVAAGSSAPRVAPIRRPRVIASVITAAVLVITAIAILAIVIAQQLAQAETVNDAARTTDLLADLVVQPALVDGLLTGDQAAVASMDSAVRAKVLGPSLVRVKIWTQQGTIVYSDEPALIDETYALDADELEAFAAPRHPHRRRRPAGSPEPLRPARRSIAQGVPTDLDAGRDPTAL